MSGKYSKGIPLFSVKMEAELVMEWTKVIENHFECEGISEAQRVSVEKSRMGGASLTWWKFMQDERVKEGNNPITNWKGMVEKVRETYLPNDYEVKLYKKRQNFEAKGPRSRFLH